MDYPPEDVRRHTVALFDWLQANVGAKEMQLAAVYAWLATVSATVSDPIFDQLLESVADLRRQIRQDIEAARATAKEAG